jgi:hypothetical protein
MFEKGEARIMSPRGKPMKTVSQVNYLAQELIADLEFNGITILGRKLTAERVVVDHIKKLLKKEARRQQTKERG